MPLQCDCHVLAMSLPCHCHALPCHCHVIALSLPMSLPGQCQQPAAASKRIYVAVVALMLLLLLLLMHARAVHSRSGHRN